eukprot:4098260-Pleurochrysis_carterae.AAC.1
MVNGCDAGGGLARLRGDFDAVVRRGDVGHARTGARRPGAERERFVSTPAMPMQRWETVHASDKVVDRLLTDLGKYYRDQIGILIILNNYM